jgi:hypothetical protein
MVRGGVGASCFGSIISRDGKGRLLIWLREFHEDTGGGSLGSLSRRTAGGRLLIRLQRMF